KKEEKEPKLIAFLECVLPTTPPGSEFCVLVQSASSPALKAISGLAARFGAHGVSFRIIIARASNLPPLPGADFRQLADVRCHDAHELLVAGTRHAWVGDSMRRNPATTDSFELQVVDCAQTTATVAMSFERLWKIATPVVGSRSAVRRDLALAGELAGIAGEQGSTVTALTRH
ncbi:MAG: hypothetical protein K2Y05_07370, partial [Hyphomicrobiaceae bacterium]|nr:hypothetical protein [Hyphomicrobiaceae bacterium]